MSRRLLLVSAAVLTTVLGPAASGAQAADPPAETGPTAVSTLQGVTPSVLTPEQQSLTLTGSVHNTGDTELQNVQALPRFSRVPLDSRTDVRRVSADEEINPGQRYGDVHDVVGDSLQPGEVGTFSLEIPTTLLEFDQAGVYTVGVDIRATTPEDGARITVSSARTVVPWVDSPGELPTVPVGLMWPLAARPTSMPGGTLLDDSVAAQLGTEGSLTGLVEAGAGAPVTWALDPDLLDTVNVMAEGYQVMSPSGPVEGSQADSDAAREWQRAFSDATSEREVWVLPYALPDVASLVAGEPDLAGELSVQAQVAAEGTAESIEGTAGVAWLDAASVTDQVLGTLAEAGTRTVVVPGNAVEESTALGEVTAGEHTMRVVAADLGLSDALGDAAAVDDPQAAAVDLRQRWIAETAMVALAAAADDTEPGLLVAAPPVRWQPDPSVAQSIIDTWSSIPWVAATDVAGAEPPEPRERFTLNPVEGTNLLPAANVEATATLEHDATQYASLLADDDGVTDRLMLATLRSASTGWRDDPVAGAAYAAAITDDLSARFNRISVTVPESVTLSSRTGSFPLTITNDLSEAVTVTLDIHSTNVDRLRVEEVEPTLVQPGERQQVTVTAEAAANGRVPIAVRLTTADGVPIGPAQPTIVNATDYGTIGWIIVGGAGALFAAAIVRRTLRKGRDDDADPTTDAASVDDESDGRVALAQKPSPAQEVTR
ncbi:DUF6049 family protein [Jiangella gansuensis]|uniref:DUF6049 family protein n=1 Tax=Jiangella gansuensis TaxID=281473 RepID=UPI00047991A7|nr:DUF6049 family protein [Jiangella gansuensis]